MELAARAQTYIRDVADFPKPGILFKDIAPLLASPQVFGEVVQWFADHCHNSKTGYIAGIESRGFLIGAAVALRCGLPFVPIRKPGKLPGDVLEQSYELEYGTDSVEIQKDAIPAGSKVTLIDDVLATGGTAGAAHKLLLQQGAQVTGHLFLLELGFLNGQKRLAEAAPKIEINSLIVI